MLGPMRGAAVGLLLGLAACGTTSTPTRARWYTLEGAEADPAAVRAAAARCRESRIVRDHAGPGNNVEFGLAMLDCLRGEGFVRVTDDPELAR
jgi:hypothetical protein